MDVKQERQSAYLDLHVFKGLENQNTGFDASSIKYFFEADFNIVLERVEKLGIGIHGIEPWKNGEFYGVLTFEDYGNKSTNPKWYWKAFRKFTEFGEELQYAATYDVPQELLEQ